VVQNRRGGRGVLGAHGRVAVDHEQPGRVVLEQELEADRLAVRGLGDVVDRGDQAELAVEERAARVLLADDGDRAAGDHHDQAVAGLRDRLAERVQAGVDVGQQPLGLLLLAEDRRQGGDVAAQVGDRVARAGDVDRRGEPRDLVVGRGRAAPDDDEVRLLGGDHLVVGLEERSDDQVVGGEPVRRGAGGLRHAVDGDPELVEGVYRPVVEAEHLVRVGAQRGLAPGVGDRDLLGGADGADERQSGREPDRRSPPEHLCCLLVPAAGRERVRLDAVARGQSRACRSGLCKTCTSRRSRQEAPLRGALARCEVTTRECSAVQGLRSRVHGPPGAGRRHETGGETMTIGTPRRWSGPNRTGRTQVNLLEQVGRRVLHVSRVADLAPRYRRVYLTGEDLAAGFPYVRFAPTDHVKLVFPDPATGELTLPTPGRGLRGEEGGPRPVFRDYTVRAWLPDSRELALEFVLHGEGVGSTWAANARPGDVVGVLGPRGNIVFPEDHARYLLAGDEAALPAICRFVEELPEGATATVAVEVKTASEAIALASRDGVEVLWVARDVEGEGGLERAVRRLAPVAEGGWFAFVAGEVAKVKPIRDFLRLELGLPRERVVADGYWKRGVANLDHHSVDLNAD